MAYTPQACAASVRSSGPNRPKPSQAIPKPSQAIPSHPEANPRSIPPPLAIDVDYFVMQTAPTPSCPLGSPSSARLPKVDWTSGTEATRAFATRRLCSATPLLPLFPSANDGLEGEGGGAPRVAKHAIRPNDHNNMADIGAVGGRRVRWRKYLRNCALCV
ncbi:hypothetical protein PMIN03_013088 [Paraphaeosphaeria minitans]